MKEKMSLFKQERRQEIKAINKKYQDLQRRNVTIVGPIQAGKTQLFRSLINQPFSDHYEQEETAKTGFQVFSTVKSRYENLDPLSLHVIDAPGQLMRNMRCAEHYFGQADIILIAFDISLVLDQEKIDTTSQFVLEQVSQWHDYTTNENVIPPMILHVFTKQDRINKASRKRNEAVLKNLARNGIIGNFLYVSTKDGEGMSELKQAIFDCDIKGHGEKVFPQSIMKKANARKAKGFSLLMPKKTLDPDASDSDEDFDLKKPKLPTTGTLDGAAAALQ